VAAVAAALSLLPDLRRVGVVSPISAGAAAAGACAILAGLAAAERPSLRRLAVTAGRLGGGLCSAIESLVRQSPGIEELCLVVTGPGNAESLGAAESMCAAIFPSPA